MMTEHALLVVEDDPELREAVSDLLRTIGYVVTCAANGQEALACLRESRTRFCLILLDLMMPVMDGWQFREEQRKDPSMSSIPVVAFSAHADLRSIDASDFLRKPVTMDALVRTITRFCHPPNA